MQVIWFNIIRKTTSSFTDYCAHLNMRLSAKITVVIFAFGFVERSGGAEQNGLEYNQPVECVQLEKRDKNATFEKKIGCDQFSGVKFRVMLQNFLADHCVAEKNETILKNCDPTDYELKMKYECIGKLIQHDCADDIHGKLYEMEDIDTTPTRDELDESRRTTTSENCFKSGKELESQWETDVDTRCTAHLRCFGRDDTELEYKPQIDQARALYMKYEIKLNACVVRTDKN